MDKQVELISVHLENFICIDFFITTVEKATMTSKTP